MSVGLTEAIQQAEVAIDSGDYQSAVETCRRIVSQYPGFGSAYQLLGQAYLRQGQPGEAEQAFSRALTLNPRQAPAYLGLGVIAEERGVLDSALAYCQVAWELLPQSSRYREPVVRIASRQFGADGQLQFTRAALAQIHVNAARSRRAVNEYQAALSQLPDRVDLWMGLAETLWQLGGESDAAEISREFLKEYPDLVQGLAILADIEHRRGNHQEADQLRERLRKADPDGAIVAEMLARNDRADRDYLLLPADETPTLDEQADVVVAERPHIAPAPDFTYQPSTDDDAAAVDGAPGQAQAEAGGAEASESVDDLSAEFEGLQPMEPEEFGLNESETDADAEQWETGQTASREVGTSELGELFAQPTDDQADGGVSEGETHSAELADLAQSLEDSVAGAVDRATESSGPAEPEQSESSEPSPPSGTGYTTLIGELGQEGLQPFDPSRSGHESSQEDDFGNLTAGWDELDAEIESAIPPTTGHTEELRTFDDLGLDPFRVEDDEPADADQLAAFDPFGSLTPGSGAEEMATPETEEPGQPTAESGPAESHADTDDVIEGIEPFSLEEFENDTTDDQTFSFGNLPWDESEESGGSMLPSDEDLDAMLGSFELQAPEAAGSAEPSPADPLSFEGTGQASGQEEPAGTDEASETAPPEVSPSPEWYQFDDPMGELDASMAATRELGGSTPVDQEAEQQHAETWSTESEYPHEIQEPGEPTHAEEAPGMEEAEIPAEPHPSTDLFPRTDAEKLVSDEELFERSRMAKNELIAEGVIRGDLELAGDQPAEEPAPATGEPEQVPEPAEPFEVSTGASQDVDTLRTSLQAAPDDDELHWWLAEALRKRGDVQDAFVEYRWLIRHAPHRHDAIIQALTESVAQRQIPEMAHRLLADIYRRHGDSSRASHHASMAMAERRRSR